jgi:hypothetical protein
MPVLGPMSYDFGLGDEGSILLCYRGAARQPLAGPRTRRVRHSIRIAPSW